jgi:general secretion pathway protein E
MAQRLVRLLCHACREAHELTEAEAQLLGLEGTGGGRRIFRPAGCPRCNGSGYRGRAGIYELIEIGDELRAMIHEGASEQDMLRAARRRHASIQDDGRRRVLAGETSLEEVMRVTSLG